ncbi:MAG: hypothetical protein WCV99_02285 [Sterolibacterium sp.]|jgi:hypothetical protein
MSKNAFVVRLPEDERSRAKEVAEKLGPSENRLYAELIHDGLLIQEQMLYMSKLREMGAKVSREAALAVFDRVPDVPPEPQDRPIPAR